MAFDSAVVDYESGKKGVVWDITDTNAVTQILAYDTSTRVFLVDRLQFGCLSGRALLFDHSMAGGKCIGILRCVSGNYVVEDWDFEGDPMKINPCVSVGAGICISANAAVVHGMLKYTLGA